jgi:serine/threonine-protein kinase
MKTCPICKTKYPEDANFCPLETCATADGPQRLASVPDAPEPRFTPIERIGGGNTGEVWRARDGQTGAEVVLKLVNQEVLGSPASQSRAEREFKQLMRVSSPKVATIIDSGKLPDQRFFVAMELFPGESLASSLRTGPLDLDTAKGLIAQIGQALLEAQKAGLVHRDVSPKNVLVGSTGDVKIINFPLAKPVTDRVAGDPAYLSPEQAQGKPADQRSNTYSLAAILYHMLTGEPPFQAATPQAVLDMHVSSPLLPPSQRRPDAGISAEADRLILKAMDKSSSRRHLTLRLFLTELESVKAAVPGAAAARPAGGDVGLAKTMLFAGNQADIARMVAEAKAAKASTSVAQASRETAAPAPVAAVVANPSLKASAVSAEPTISVMDTMAAEPTAPVQPAPAAHSAPVAVAAPPAAQPRAAAPAARPAQGAQPASAAQRSATPSGGGGRIKPAEAGKTPPPKAGAAFRETLWFKKGDVDQMVADAKAKLAAGTPAAEEEPPTDDARPLEDRYLDDGSVTTEDRKKFSLRTGGTGTALPAAAATIPGEKMTERGLVEEIGRGRRTAILLVAAVVLVALAVVVAMMMKGKVGNRAHPTHSSPPAAASLSVPPPAALPPPAVPPQAAVLPAAVPPPAPAIPPPTAATPPIPAPTPAAPEKKTAAAGLGANDDAVKPSAGGAVSGAETTSAKKPAKSPAPPHRAKPAKKKH